MSKDRDLAGPMSDAEGARWLARMQTSIGIRLEGMAMLGAVLFSEQEGRVKEDPRFALAELACKTFVAACTAQDQALHLAIALLSDEYEPMSDEDLAKARDVYEHGIRLGGGHDEEARSYEIIAVRKKS